MSAWNGQCVQRAVFSASQSTADLTGAFPSNVTAGNLLVAIVSWYGVLSPAVTISDSLGNVYTLVAASVSHPDGSSGMAVYYCANCLGGANSVTFHTPSNVYRALEIGEYPGTSSTTLDTASATTGTSTTVASPSITPAGVQELLIAGVSNGNTITPTVPAVDWTERPSQLSGAASSTLLVADRINFTTTGHTFSCTCTGTMNWACAIAAFKNMGPPAAGGSGGGAIIGSNIIVPSR